MRPPRLVVSELALAVVLLTGAGLMIRSFARLTQVAPGFTLERVLSMRLGLPQPTYTEDHRWIAFFRQLLPRIQSLPGMQFVAAAQMVPLAGGAHGGTGWAEDRPRTPENSIPLRYTAISPDYFRAFDTPLLSGRSFTEQDTEVSTPVVILGEALARRVWPDDDPLGKRLRFDWSNTQPGWREVVGIVQTVKYTSLRAAPDIPVLYVPFTQPLSGWKEQKPSMALVVRTSHDPERIVAAIRREIAASDSGVPVYDVRTMTQVLHEQTARPRFSMGLLGVFALATLVLASVGIYGVLSRSTARRTHEIGIRMALGARRVDVLKLVVRKGLMPTFIGVGVGLAAALALTRVMSSLLFEVSATDPSAFLGVTLLLTAVALLACCLPARRAAKVEPMVALRYE